MKDVGFEQDLGALSSVDDASFSVERMFYSKLATQKTLSTCSLLLMFLGVLFHIMRAGCLVLLAVVPH
jgi:hypothetical protein